LRFVHLAHAAAGDQPQDAKTLRHDLSGEKNRVRL
jgi:hypothetical protein